jgi:hypothetical protein
VADQKNLAIHRTFAILFTKCRFTMNTLPDWPIRNIMSWLRLQIINVIVNLGRIQASTGVAY